jgi:hypothetical protein
MCQVTLVCFIKFIKSNSKKTKSKWILKIDKKYFWNQLKNTCSNLFFLLENLMKLICHKLGNEYQHMF